MTLRFRAAQPEDAYCLWIWANDPETRKASGDRALISWDRHVDWLARRIRGGEAFVLVAEAANGQPIGSVRFETSDDWRHATLSYVVAPEARGLGYGKQLLVGGIELVRGRFPDLRLEALVRETNPRSRRLFESLGWQGVDLGAGELKFAPASEAA